MFVTIDLDGVLIQNPFAKGVFPAVRHLIVPTLKAKGMDEGEAATLVMRRVRDGHQQRLARGDWVGAYDWDAIVNEAAAELGYNQPIHVAALVRRFCQPGYIAAYSDVEAALAYLRQRFDKVYWLSNGFAIYQEPVVEALGLAQYFDGAFAPDTHGSAKPAPGLFHAAAQAAGFSPDLGLHIGDTLTHDVGGARSAGMSVVWIERSLAEEWQGYTLASGERSEAFSEVIAAKASREECYEVYGLELPDDCLPDVAISTLDQLPQALDALQRDGLLRAGA